MRRTTLTGGIALAASILALVAAPVAGASTFRNDNPIVIPASGNATSYPWSITVSGTAGPITDVNLGLDGFTHGRPYDLGIALVPPAGPSLLLMDCVGDDTDASDVDIALDDPPAAKLPTAGALSSGTFQPTSQCGPPGPPEAPASFPAPGPTNMYSNPGPGIGGTATFASTFNGLSAIGTWKLYVHDFAPPNGGSITGWSLDVQPDVTPLPPAIPTPAITPTPTPTPAPATKKCKKKKSGGTAAASACKKKKKK